MSPGQQRAAADYLGERYGVSQRRAGRVMGRSRSTLRYREKRAQGEPMLVREIKRLARRQGKHVRLNLDRVRRVIALSEGMPPEQVFMPRTLNRDQRIKAERRLDSAQAAVRLPQLTASKVQGALLAIRPQVGR